jgi:transglutaminase-like putative cysteine protease
MMTGKRRRAFCAVLLAAAFALADPVRPDGPTPRVRTFEFTYITEVKDIPAGARELSLWIPYPQSDENQTIRNMTIRSPYPTQLTRESEYGNQMLYLHLSPPPEKGFTVEMRFTVERREYVRRDFSLVKAGYEDRPDPMLRRWLEPDKLVPIDGRIRQMALEVTRGRNTDLEKARAIYDYAVTNLKYDKSGTGWGRGDIYYACDVKRGNCTDFHAVFIGFSRAVGIPARFEIGFPLPSDRSDGEIAGYHCWAQFYLKGYGWVPVDASEASKNPALHDYFFGGHDEHRVLFTIGRDVRLSPPQKGDPLNYFIYPYAEVDGKPFAQIGRKFSFRDVRVETRD